MPDAKCIQLADAAAQRISAAWNPVAPNEILRDYVIPAKVDAIVGRKVWIWPVAHATQGPATRAADIEEHQIALVIAERYTGTEPRPPKAWIDERVNFVEQSIWDLLSDVRNQFLVENVWPQSGEILVFDWTMLNKLQTFWSEIELTFREEI